MWIDEQQADTLKRLSAETGLSQSAIVRQAIDDWLQLLHPSRKAVNAWNEERAFIESLIEQGPEGKSRAWRREKLHER